jgi:hypothetical protein
MRRGLIAWSKTELPEAALAARVERLRAAMREAGLEHFLVYTNNTRPAGASYLSGFVPYWSEAVLVVPREGKPVLVAALSKRVRSWMESTCRVAEVISAPRLGRGAGKLIAQLGGGVVGVAELDGMQAGIVDDLRAEGAALADATPLFARVRAKADPAELALAARAGAIAHRGLAEATAASRDAGAAVAQVEDCARRLGAEECYVAIAADLARDRRLLRPEGSLALGSSFALRATIAYKGVWVRAARTLFRDAAAAPRARRAAERFAEATTGLPGAAGFAGIDSWLVEGCRTTQPLEPLLGSRVSDGAAPGAGALVSVQACLEIDGEPILMGAPALLGANGESAALLLSPLYDEGG